MSDINHFDNTHVYQEDWAETVQEFLDTDNKWEKICKVVYTDTKTLNFPYLTRLTVQTGSRGTPYSPQAVTVVNESVAIDTYSVAPYFMDRADLAQCSYADQMELASIEGTQLRKKIEAAMYEGHTSFTDFDNASIGGSAGNITVSVSNVYKIVTGIIREIQQADGGDLANQNGIFIVWKPQHFEILVQYATSMGFSTADQALKMGNTADGWDYLGVTHYYTNLGQTNHVFGGVKKALYLGICRATYGQVILTQDPMNVSGIGIISRADYKFKAWNNFSGILFDILATD